MFKKSKKSKIDFQKASSSYYQIENQEKDQAKTKFKAEIKSIYSLLGSVKNFYGCFTLREFINLNIDSVPIKLIIKIGRNPNDHYIAIFLNKNFLEVFDPFGFNLSYPQSFLRLLRDLSFKRRLRITIHKITNNRATSILFCAFFLRQRQFSYFSKIITKFSSHYSVNDKYIRSVFNEINH